MKEKKYEDSGLLILLAEDSQYAFQLLFHRYKDHVYNVAIRYVKVPSMAEEIVQDVFMKVWLNRKNLVVLQSFESWLYVVSKNLIVSFNNRLALEWQASRRFQRKNSSSENNTDHRIRDFQYQELLQKAVSQLSPQQQLVYRMAREEHLSYVEMGQRMNISPLTVKTHMTRSLNSIRSFLKKHGEIIP